MVREREAFIARTNEKAKTIMDRAGARAKEMVSEANIIAEAVEEDDDIVMPVDERGRDHPLVALWRRSAAPAVAAPVADEAVAHALRRNALVELALLTAVVIQVCRLQQQLFEQRHKHQVRADITVFSVIDNEHELFFEQAWVDRVTYPPAAGNPEVQLHVPVIVPRQRCDARKVFDQLHSDIYAASFWQGLQEGLPAQTTEAGCAGCR